MLGVSFSELIFVALIAVIVVGPKRLPMMLNTLGAWSAKLRQMIFQARTQSGIEDILRQEGLLGGLRELRQLRQTVRTEIAELGRVVAEGQAMTTGALHPTVQAPYVPASQQTYTPSPAENPSLEAPRVVYDPYSDVPLDLSREYPVEGCDAGGAIGDDLYGLLAVHQYAPPPSPPEAAPGDSSSSADNSQTHDAASVSDSESAQPSLSNLSPDAALSPETALKADEAVKANESAASNGAAEKDANPSIVQ